MTEKVVKVRSGIESLGGTTMEIVQNREVCILFCHISMYFITLIDLVSKYILSWMFLLFQFSFHLPCHYVRN